MKQLTKKSMIEAHAQGPAHECDLDASFSSSHSSSSSSISGISSGSSMESDSSEVTSPASDPLSDMSSLFQQLPIKRGLSNYYQGKSQSFTSLAQVRSLEDLAKPQNPYNKKLKSCRSYGEGLKAETHRTKCNPDAMSREISKRGLNSRGSCYSLSAKRGSAPYFTGGTSRPPIPHSSTSTISNPTTLFA